MKKERQGLNRPGNEGNLENTQICEAALVTGGSRGIGRAICLELAGRGYSLIIGYAGNEAAAEETEALCGEKKISAEQRFIPVRGDVSVSEDAEHLVEETVRCFGRIDVLVNNAGITRDGLILTMKDSDFDEVIAANLRGAFLCSRAAAKQMVRKKKGCIISVSSVTGIHGNAGQSNYAASKAGIIGLTKSLARELAPRNIRVNAIAPGFMETDMTRRLPEKVREAYLSDIPLKRAGRPEEAAHAVGFLVSEEASYITGQVLAVDGGMGM